MQAATVSLCQARMEFKTTTELLTQQGQVALVQLLQAAASPNQAMQALMALPDLPLSAMV